MTAPFIRTVNVAGYVRQLPDAKLVAVASGMRVNPKNYAPSFRRAVASEVERRATINKGA